MDFEVGSSVFGSQLSIWLCDLDGSKSLWPHFPLLLNGVNAHLKPASQERCENQMSSCMQEHLVSLPGGFHCNQNLYFQGGEEIKPWDELTFCSF